MDYLVVWRGCEEGVLWALMEKLRKWNQILYPGSIFQISFSRNQQYPPALVSYNHSGFRIPIPDSTDSLILSTISL